MDANLETTDAWGECPAGELQGLATRLKAAERRRQNLSIAKVAAGTMATTAGLVLAIGLMLNGGEAKDMYGSLACADCKANFDAYAQYLDTTQGMDTKLASQMSGHLRDCGFCKSAFESMFPGKLEQSNALSANTTPIIDAASIDSFNSENLGYAAAF